MKPNKNAIVNAKSGIPASVRKFFSRAGKKGHRIARETDAEAYSEKQRRAALALWRKKRGMVAKT